jgi:hypothetical protein
MKTTKRTPGAIRAIRQMAYTLTAACDANHLDLKAIALLLAQGANRPSNGRITAEDFKPRMAQLCLTRWKELPSVHEENPLDDQDKLDEVRRLVFGSAPQSNP